MFSNFVSTEGRGVGGGGGGDFYVTVGEKIFNNYDVKLMAHFVIAATSQPIQNPAVDFAGGAI